MTHEIGITGLVAALVLAIQHWFPWQKLFRAPLPRLVAYIMGTLALMVPLTALAVWTGETTMAVAIPFVTLFGGATVIMAYAIDGRLNQFADWLSERKLRE